MMTHAVIWEHVYSRPEFVITDVFKALALEATLVFAWEQVLLQKNRVCDCGRAAARFPTSGSNQCIIRIL